MHEAASSILTAWSNFYVITGSAGGTLTGLMFVVVTLIQGSRSRERREGLATFSTPTVVHFCAALMISATICAPWRSLAPAGVLLGLTGLYGVAYVLLVMYRARRLTEYRPQFEDWLWHTILPLAAYLTVVVGAIVLAGASATALFALGGATLLLIFVGIHNAWDVVTYLAVESVRKPDAAAPIQSNPSGNDEASDRAHH